jgi:hypothetical protein
LIPASWTVFDKDQAVSKWLETEPPTGWVSEVLAWLRAFKLAGPPGDARDLGHDLYIALVPRTRSFVEYLQIDYERLIILKAIR